MSGRAVDCTLTLAAADLAPEDVHDLSLDLARSLADEAGVDAEPVERAGTGSSRGDALTIGTLALTFLTSGTAAALLNVFKSYFDRSSGVTVELARPDGVKLTVRVDDLRAGQFERTLSLAHQFLEARP
jgi:hypothetical protein